MCVPAFAHPFVHESAYTRTYAHSNLKKSAVSGRKSLIHSAEHHVLAPLFNTDLTRAKSFLTFCNGCLTKLATRFWHQFGTSLKNMRLFERVRGGFEHSGVWGPFSAFLGAFFGFSGCLSRPLFIPVYQSNKCIRERA